MSAIHEHPARYADTVLVNGNVVTVDPRQPRARAVAVRGATILAVSADDDLGDLTGRTPSPSIWAVEPSSRA